MANIPITLTRTAYTEVASADTVLSISLPDLPLRVGNVDRVELVASTSAITGSNIPEVGVPYRGAIVLENTGDQFGVLVNFTVNSGEKLYARWLGAYNYLSDDDLYVTTF